MFRKEGQVCKSSQLLSRGMGFKSKKADPGACYSTSSCLASPNLCQAPQPLTPITFSLSFIKDVGCNLEECSISVSFVTFFFLNSEVFPLTNQIDSLNLDIGSVTVEMKFPSICQLGLCQRLALNF